MVRTQTLMNYLITQVGSKIAGDTATKLFESENVLYYFSINLVFISFFDNSMKDTLKRLFTDTLHF